MSHAPSLSSDHLSPHDDHTATKRLSALGGWGMSAAIHLAAVALAAVAVFATPPRDIEKPPVRITPPLPTHVPIDHRDLNRTVIITNDPLVLPNEPNEPVMPTTPVDLPPDPTDPTPDPTASDLPQGRPDANAIAEQGGSSGIITAIGTNGSGTGAYGARTGDRKKIASIKHGSNRVTEQAVDTSLRWFKRHQSPEGAWDPRTYYQHCSDAGGKCEPGQAHAEYATAAEEDTLAITGFAVLCYLGAGYDHYHRSTFTPVVKKGLAWLLTQQRGGAFGHRNYEHAIVTMALAEAYGMTNDPALREPTQKAVNILLSRQNQNATKGSLGWDYWGATTRNDASVTGWNVMALKAAYLAGLNVGQGLVGAKSWLNAAWRAANSPALVKAGACLQGADHMTINDQSRFPYVWTTGQESVNVDTTPLAGADKHAKPRHPDMNPKPGSGGALEGVGLLCSVYLGHQAGDPLTESLANTIMAHAMPKSYPCNTYAAYYNTFAIFQMGGERWKTWNGTVRDVLVNSQRHYGGCFDGSWDFEGTGSSATVGRTLATALNTLCLEVYYRSTSAKAVH